MTARGRITWMSPDDIRPYEGNPRKNDRAVQAVANSIREFGFRSPIIVDADMTIIAGHTRHKAALALGLEEVPVLVAADLTPEQVQAYRLADNRTGELAEWDAELLAQELDSIGSLDMGLFGFENADFTAPEAFEEPVPLGEVVEVEPDDSAPDRVKPGELWRMGDHVLLCADSTDPDSIRRVMDAMGGGSADMLLTDPPYNVDITGCTSDELKIQNDSFDDEASFKGFLLRAFKAAQARMKAGASAYIWLASMHLPSFASAMVEAGISWRQVLVWAKNTFALGRQDYQWRHELCLYGWKDGAAHYFYDSRTETTVIEDAKPDPKKMTKAELVKFAQSALTERQASTVLEFDKPSRSEEHPTMKPVKLFAYLVRNSSKPGEVVLDPFGGSGTSVVACEQLKRRCATVELDPHYASVIVERWERLTGNTAVRVDG